MIDVVCIKLGKETGSFTENIQFSDGEEYTAKILLTGEKFLNVNVDLQWEKSSDMFIRFKIYSDITGSYLCRRSIVVNNGTKASAGFSFNHSSYNSLLMISVLPCRNLTKRAVSQPSLNCLDQNNAKSAKVPVAAKRLEQLSEDMKSLLNSGALSDIIISDGKSEIQAHKLILSVRSPVFAEMFQHEKKEILINIPMEVFRKLLGFLYTGVVEIECVRMAMNLYAAAGQYKVQDLKIACSQVLKDVDLDNVLEVVILADLHRDKSLKQAATNFIVRNYKEVKQLEQWADFLTEKQELAIEVLSSVSDNIS